MLLDWRVDKEDVVGLHNWVLHRRKNNGILKFAGKWMDLENIMLNEVTQTQKDKYHMYSLFHNWVLEIKQSKPAYK